MQRRLDNNNILMYSTHNENKSLVAGRFIRTFKKNISKKMTGDNGKTYLCYLNKLVEE